MAPSAVLRIVHTGVLPLICKKIKNSTLLLRINKVSKQ